MVFIKRKNVDFGGAISLGPAVQIPESPWMCGTGCAMEVALSFQK